MPFQRLFLCDTCPAVPETEGGEPVKPQFDSFEGINQHLVAVHHLPVDPGRRGPRGSRRTQLTLDGAHGWFQNTHKWVFGWAETRVVVYEREEGQDD